MKPVEKQTFEKSDYQGASPSTLCLGCGHDQISRHIIQAFYQAGLNPFSIAKISGIGCSSKTPNYFLKQSRGFNSIHGRMASVATGLKIANRNLKALGVSGDGDTGSIGLGSFLHTVRKNVPMIYIVENNGVYGLTKGQFSATAQKDSSLKKRENNPFFQMDLCRLALSAGCGFIARAFSGDNKQLTQLLKLAVQYKGFAFIDVISPCVAYGNEKEFPHSFHSMKENKLPLNELDIIVEASVKTEDISEGEIKNILLPNGNVLVLKKLKDHDPTQKKQAVKILEEGLENRQTATGLIYYHNSSENFLDQMNLSDTALVEIEDARLSSQDLNDILDHYC